jgi:hypothetical protein
MTAKAGIVAHLGEKAVLLPSLIGDGLAANDRIKLRLSMLQEAAAHARAPQRVAFRIGTVPIDGIDPDALISGARILGQKRLFIPDAAQLLAGLKSDLAKMVAPLEIAQCASAKSLRARAEAIERAVPLAAEGELVFDEIDQLTRADPDAGDSFHLLVMDVHKALNRLSAETAIETLDGAHVHSLGARDRRAVKAFMRGLNRTAPLAFGHPGLATTAARAGEHLTIENDIGTTGAHVLVIHVDRQGVKVTYTDIHRPRAKFFISLFDGKGVAWQGLCEQHEARLAEDGFYLLEGCYRSEDEGAIDRFLEFLGSRIVFLIDWNKARKALQTFVGKNVAIDLLTWAAREDHGHRAFLELGGADLIFEAAHRVAAGRIPYGVRLDEALGNAECVEFLERVLKDTSQGLAAGRTARLIRDEVHANLARRFETAESSVLTTLVRHLGLSRSLAAAIGNELSVPGLTDQATACALARRAKQIEEKADRLTVSAREIAARIREPGPLKQVIDEVENTTDSLEECAYLMSIVPDAERGAFGSDALARLAEIATESVSQLVRATEAASRLPKGQRADALASLQAIDAVVVAERRADAAERDSLAALMSRPCGDARALALGIEVARALETATDHLLHAALSLRERVLQELST